MNIPIEIIIVFVVIVYFLFWTLLMFIIKYSKKRRYKPENDKGKLAEESRRKGGGSRETGNTNLTSIPRPVLSQRRDLFQTTTSNTVGKDESSNGETSRSIRKPINPFLRRRKR